MSEWHVISAGGSDNHSGSDNGTAPIVSGSSAGVTSSDASVDLSADLTAGEFDLISVGDKIRLNTLSNGINSTDIYEITAIEPGGPLVEVSPTPNASGTVAWAIGGAFATPQRALSVVQAGDTAWIKEGTYAGTFNIVTAGTITAPILVAGYLNAPGDGLGFFTIDATGETSGLTSTPGATLYYVFENMKVTGATGAGVSAVTCDIVTFRNCWIHDNGGDGVDMDNDIYFDGCRIFGNGGIGIDCDSNVFILGCEVFDNALEGAQLFQSVTALFSSFWNNGAGGANKAQISTLDSAIRIANCTFDGESVNGAEGIRMSAVNLPFSIANCIFVGFDGTSAVPIVLPGASGRLAVTRNNVFFECNASPNYVGSEGDLTSDPLFWDYTGHDLRLTTLSPARGAGFPAYLDIGAHQSEGRILRRSFDQLTVSGAFDMGHIRDNTVVTVTTTPTPLSELLATAGAHVQPNMTALRMQNIGTAAAYYLATSKTPAGTDGFAIEPLDMHALEFVPENIAYLKLWCASGTVKVAVAQGGMIPARIS